MTLHYALWNLVHLVEAIVLTVVRSVCKCSKLFNAKTNHDHCLLKMLVVWILYTNLEKEKPITGESYAAFIIWSTFGPENSYFSTTIHDAPAVFFFFSNWLHDCCCYCLLNTLRFKLHLRSSYSPDFDSSDYSCSVI